MSKVFFSVTMSLDGFIAPEWQSDEQWMRQWSQLQAYAFEQNFTRRNLGLGEGGETGLDNRILEQVFQRTGATVIGKRMFDGGERFWPEEAPFHTPVFVVTNQRREPWPRPGGTVFHFVNDGIRSAIAQAREAAGERDVRIGGGANLIQQALRAGLVDEFHLALSPMLLGEGRRLFERIDPEAVGLEVVEAQHSARVMHLRYALRKAEA